MSVSSITVKADSGDADAQNELGTIFEFGQNVAKNLQQAVHYYKLSASQHHAVGSYNYARCLQHGLGVRPDSKSAMKFYKIAADDGISEAALELGKIYRSNNDFRNADKYLNKHKQAN